MGCGRHLTLIDAAVSLRQHVCTYVCMYIQQRSLLANQSNDVTSVMKLRHLPLDMRILHSFQVIGKVASQSKNMQPEKAQINQWTSGLHLFVPLQFFCIVTQVASFMLEHSQVHTYVHMN